MNRPHLPVRHATPPWPTELWRRYTMAIRRRDAAILASVFTDARFRPDARPPTRRFPRGTGALCAMDLAPPSLLRQALNAGLKIAPAQANSARDILVMALRALVLNETDSNVDRIDVLLDAGANSDRWISNLSTTRVPLWWLAYSSHVPHGLRQRLLAGVPPDRRVQRIPEGPALMDWWMGMYGHDHPSSTRFRSNWLVAQIDVDFEAMLDDWRERTIWPDWFRTGPGATWQSLSDAWHGYRRHLLARRMADLDVALATRPDCAVCAMSGWIVDSGWLPAAAAVARATGLRRATLNRPFVPEA